MKNKFLGVGILGLILSLLPMLTTTTEAQFRRLRGGQTVKCENGVCRIVQPNAPQLFPIVDNTDQVMQDLQKRFDQLDEADRLTPKQKSVLFPTNEFKATIEKFPISSRIVYESTTTTTPQVVYQTQPTSGSITTTYYESSGPSTTYSVNSGVRGGYGLFAGRPLRGALSIRPLRGVLKLFCCRGG